MDFNDIESRLKRLYLSINQQFECDVLNNMQTKTEKNGSGIKISITFDAKHNNDETINRINAIIGGLANLKDHLKTRFKQQGGDPQKIEDEIKQNLSLQIVLDLYNQEKHGYPLQKIKHSYKDPRIINISKALTAIPGKIATEFIKNPLTGAGYSNNMAIIITADIVDKDGNLIFYWNDLVNKALNDWEGIMIKYNLI